MFQYKSSIQEHLENISNLNRDYCIEMIWSRFEGRNEMKDKRKCFYAAKTFGNGGRLVSTCIAFQGSSWLNRDLTPL